MNYKEIDFTNQIIEAKEKKTLNKPFRTPGGPKKFSVYVKNEKGNVVKVNFGDPNMEIKRDDPARRKSFRARHNCSDPGPKWKARYWSCKQWRAGKKVEGSHAGYDWDGETIFDLDDLIAQNPDLALVEEEITEEIEANEECGDCGCGGCDKDETKAEEEEEKRDYASLWKNIHKKRERIKKGSGEKMRKKGDKGAPTEEQLKKAQDSDKKKDKKKS